MVGISLSEVVFDEEEACWELEKNDAGSVVVRCNRAPRLKIRAIELLIAFGHFFGLLEIEEKGWEMEKRS